MNLKILVLIAIVSLFSGCGGDSSDSYKAPETKAKQDIVLIKK